MFNLRRGRRRILRLTAAGCWLAAIALAVTRALHLSDPALGSVQVCLLSGGCCALLVLTLDASGVHADFDRRLYERTMWLREVTELARRNTAELAAVTAETRRNAQVASATLDGLRTILDEVGDEEPESLADVPAGPMLRVVETHGEAG